MSDEGASGVLAAAVAEALHTVAGLSQVADGRPVQAADAAAVIEMGPESDWGHKSGVGAEVRFAIAIRCGGERPGRVRELMEAARGAIGAIEPALAGWRLVTLTMTRARTRREQGPGWRGTVDYRARMLKE